MSRWTQYARHGLWAGVLALGLAGCVENRASVTILHATIPSEGCVVTGGGETSLSFGRLDVACAEYFNAPYYIYAAVENNLLSTASDYDVERNYIEIIEARVDLDYSGGSSSFRYPAFVLLAPGETATVQFVAIPSNVAQNLAGSLPNLGDSTIVRARFKFLYEHGEYEHETHEVEFPIEVCRGCLIEPNPPECDSGLVPDSPLTGHPCNVCQENLVDCCTQNGELICPAVDTSTEI